MKRGRGPIPRAFDKPGGRRRATLVIIAGAVALAAAAPRQSSELPSSTLRVRDGSTWVTWWTSRAAPTKWEGTWPLAARLRWRDAQPGIAWGELLLAGDGEAWRTRLVVARIDPQRVRLELDTAFAEQRAAWTVERMSAARFADVTLAVNAGQFIQALPWGWVMLNGREFLPPERGPLSSALMIDAGGEVHWTHGAAISAARAVPVAWAFQSYPTLLQDGVVPPPLRESDGGIDTHHRDARLAIGEMQDGRLIIAMTRFDALGGALGALPFGLTTPEMGAVMGALGARDAVMLDGGISAQLFLRGGANEVHSWPALRAVPLALVARRR